MIQDIDSVRTAPYLTEDENFVAPLVQASKHALHELHLATLGPNLLRGRVGDAAIKGALDEIWVVAVLAHLHEDIVQLGHADMCPTLGPGHGFHCLLQHDHSKNEKGCANVLFAVCLLTLRLLQLLSICCISVYGGVWDLARDMQHAAAQACKLKTSTAVAA